MILLFLVFTALLIFYFNFLYRIYKGLSNLKITGNSLPNKFVSVIIPFRNESKNILNSLKSIEALNYPEDNLEVFYVNDHSDDDSYELICRSKRKNNIKIISLQNGAGKKQAVEFGIAASKGELIITTDADCIHKPGWLIALVSCFDDNTAMVAGSVELKNGTNLFEKIQRLEFAGLITAGAGLIGSGDPYICNGANLAYRRNIFHKVGGFTGNSHIASGDDEFLMQKIKSDTSYEVKFCASREASVVTSPQKNVRDFYYQRKRWGSKGLFYKDKSKVLNLSFIFLFYLSLVIQIILSAINSIFLISFIIFFVLKAAAEYFIMKKASRIIFEPGILKHFILTELLHAPYIILVSIAGTFGGLVWKNRKLYR